MNRIKVLHLIKGLGRGGAETLLPETIEVHNRNKFEFYVGYFLPHKNHLVNELEQLGCIVRLIEAPSLFKMILKINDLRRLIQDWEIDVVHCHLPWSGIIGRIAASSLDVPVIYTEHNLQERYNILTRLANKATMKLNNRVIGVSEDVSISYENSAPSGPKVDRLLNGVNTQKYIHDEKERQLKRNELRISPNEILIGNIAVFRQQKRLDLWIKIAEKISQSYPHVKFILVGDGQLNYELRKQAKKTSLNDKLIFAGLQKNVRLYLSAMDIFMMTSQFEGLPIALLEALSMNKAVSVTNAGGINNLVENEVNGLVAEVTDDQQLLKNTIRLIESDELRSSLGKAGRQMVVDGFSIQRMVKDLEEIYFQTLNEN